MNAICFILVLLLIVVVGMSLLLSSLLGNIPYVEYCDLPWAVYDKAEQIPRICHTFRSVPIEKRVKNRSVTVVVAAVVIRSYSECD